MARSAAGGLRSISLVPTMGWPRLQRSEGYFVLDNQYTIIYFRFGQVICLEPVNKEAGGAALRLAGGRAQEHHGGAALQHGHVEAQQVARHALAVQAPQQRAAVGRAAERAEGLRTVHRADVPADQVAAALAAQQVGGGLVDEQDAAAMHEDAQGPLPQPVQKGVVEVQASHLHGAVWHDGSPDKVSIGCSSAIV